MQNCIFAFCRLPAHPLQNFFHRQGRIGRQSQSKHPTKSTKATLWTQLIAQTQMRLLSLMRLLKQQQAIMQVMKPQVPRLTACISAESTQRLCLYAIGNFKRLLLKVVVFAALITQNLLMCISRLCRLCGSTHFLAKLGSLTSEHAAEPMVLVLQASSGLLQATMACLQFVRFLGSKVTARPSICLRAVFLCL